MAGYWAKKKSKKEMQNFTGRGQELDFFEELLSVDEPEYLMVHLFGVGGVGKTTLMNRFEAMAKSQDILVGRANEAQRSVPDILGKFCQDLETQGISLDNFTNTYQAFNDLQQELRYDPEFTVALLENSGRVYASSTPVEASAPAESYEDLASQQKDLQNLIRIHTRALQKLKEQAASFSLNTPPHISTQIEDKEAKIEELRKQVKALSFATSDVAAGTTNLGYDDITEDRLKFVEHLHREIADPQSRELLLNADQVLTQAFAKDIGRITQNQRVFLIFDTWEFLSDFAADWLREEFLDRNLENMGMGLTLAISGREQLSSIWDNYLDIIRQFHLKPFSAKEAEQFLINQGISDSATIQYLQNLSGNLPLMLNLLSAKIDAQIDEQTATKSVIDRFLQWIPEHDSLKREAILACAIPRYFDESIIAQLVPEGDEAEIFSWLASFSFTTGDLHKKRWQYHSIVRGLMLRYLFDRNIETYRDLHQRMVDYYANRLDDLQIAEENKASFKGWQHLELERLYHKLCLNEGFADFVRRFLESFRHSAFAQELVNTFQAAQSDLLERSSYYQPWYALFESAPSCHDPVGCANPNWREVFERFVNYEGLSDSKLLAFTHYQLGFFYSEQKRYTLAEQAYIQATDLQPNYVSPYNSLGTVYRHTDQLEKAEELYRRCIELAPDYIFPYYNLGRLLHKLNRHDEAETYYQKSIELRPNLPFSYFNFANYLRKIEAYKRAAEQYRKAIEMDPEFINAYINLGAVLEELQQFSEAEQIYGQALDIW